MNFQSAFETISKTKAPTKGGCKGYIGLFVEESGSCVVPGITKFPLDIDEIPSTFF